MKRAQFFSSRAALPTTFAGGAAAAWAGNSFGYWWLTVLVGCAIGLLLRGTGRILLAAALAGVAGWGLHLLWLALQSDIGGAARVTAEIMGFGASGYLVLLLALIFGVLLSLAGAWLGAALRRAVTPQPTAMDSHR